MKINKYLILFLMLLPSLGGCKSKMKFSVEVVDDAGNPVADCDIKSIVFLKHIAGEGFGRNEYDVTHLPTDKNGVAHFNIDALSKRLAYGINPSNSYYNTYGEEFFFKESKLGVWQPENKKFKVVLKRKKNPIAMYAKKGPEFLPKEDQDIGYDLIVGDWVVPYGKGKLKDVIFNIKINKKGKGNSTSYLHVIFPNKGDGMIAFEAPIERDQKSEFRSDYEAPEKGYINHLTHTRIRKPKTLEKNTRKRTRNYYIRVRTKLDKKGNVVSAYYGKIYGDFMSFTHYLNPTPNDRNVEFDPKKNLIDTGYRGDKVQAP